MSEHPQHPQHPQLSQITREELLEGNIAGSHIVSEKPMIGYKQVQCHLHTIDPQSFIKKNSIFLNKCVAKVRVPIGATIVRSFVDYDNTKDNDCIVGTQLRTDNYEIETIVPIIANVDKRIEYDGTVVKIGAANSWFNPTFMYEQGKKYHEKLDQNVYNDCTHGLHFFFNKNNALYF